MLQAKLSNASYFPISVNLFQKCFRMKECAWWTLMKKRFRTRFYSKLLEIWWKNSHTTSSVISKLKTTTCWTALPWWTELTIQQGRFIFMPHLPQFYRQLAISTFHSPSRLCDWISGQKWLTSMKLRGSPKERQAPFTQEKNCNGCWIRPVGHS